MESNNQKKRFPLIIFLFGIVATLGALAAIGNYIDNKKKWGDFDDEF